MSNNELDLKIPWAEVKERIKETNAELTDDDLQYQNGNASALLKHLASKTNMTEQEVKAWIESVAVNKGKAS